MRITLRHQVGVARIGDVALGGKGSVTPIPDGRCDQVVADQMTAGRPVRL